MLICGQFIAKDLNLWSTLVFVHFKKQIFSDFWGPLNLLGPSKKSQLLDSWPFSMPLKTRPWMNLFKFFVLYLVCRYVRAYSCIDVRGVDIVVTSLLNGIWIRISRPSTYTVLNNSYDFWADLVHRWLFLGYSCWHPWILIKNSIPTYHIYRFFMGLIIL